MHTVKTQPTPNNPATAAEIAFRCEEAYSASTYASWDEVAQAFLDAGMNDVEAEAWMRSKHTRWAADLDGAQHGSVPAAAITRYLESQYGDKGKRDKETRGLVAGTI